MSANARTSAGGLARSSSSGRPEGRGAWRRTTSGSRRLAVLLLAALHLAAARAAAGGEEPLTPEFRRAVGLLQDDAPERRAEGERMIRAMGPRAIPQLKAWLSRAEPGVDRVRALLSNLDPTAAETFEPLAAARPYLSRALAGAWVKFHDGSYLEAQRTAEAIQRLDPESPEVWQIRRLIRQCQDRLIQKEVLEPTVEFDRLVYGVDEEPRVLFRLVNHSRSPVSIRAERSILGTLQVSFRRRFFDGSERGDERTVLVQSRAERFDIEPGGRFEREVVVPIEEPKPARSMALRVRVVGKFQPSQWGVEERNLSRVLSLPPAECWVVGPAEKPLSELPIKKLESAIFFRDIHAFFIGGQLAVWSAEDDPLLNEKLIRTLVGSLEELDATGIGIADVLLEEASGSKRDRRLKSAEEIAEHWRRWYADRRRRALEAKRPGAPLEKLLDR